MRKLKQLSWKAVRRGLIYCAPACGGQCTWADYQKAKKNAKALAASLGKEWTTHVWENLGWHYMAVSPCQRISVGPGFTAFLGDRGKPGCGRWAEHGKTAKQAVRNVIAVAKADLHKISAMIFDLPRF